MPTAEKAAAVSEIVEELRGSTAAVLTEYRGMTTAQLSALRTALGDGARYAVVKNTLTRRAVREVGLTDLEPMLQGPTAVAFVTGDVVEAARALRDASRETPLLVLKGGVVEGRTVDGDDLRALADVEPREVLLAKLAGALVGGLSSAASVLQAPLSQTARVVDARRSQLESESSEQAAA